MHERSCFITLTYDDAHLPPGLTLVKRDWQLFMKRLRERMGVPIRFFMCGEYGELRGRPHYHALLFGVDFEDKRPWSKSESGETLFRSATLETVWQLGFCLIGSVTFQSAAYVARYVMKKELGSSAGSHRSILDVTTGEIVTRAHEFSLRSLKPGIGRSWLNKFSADVFPHGSVVVRGSETTVPRYYLKIFSLQDPKGFEDLRKRRLEAADARFDDNGPGRLRVKELVLRAKLSHLKRGLSE